MFGGNHVQDLSAERFQIVTRHRMEGGIGHLILVQKLVLMLGRFGMVHEIPNPFQLASPERRPLLDRQSPHETKVRRDLHPHK